MSVNGTNNDQFAKLGTLNRAQTIEIAVIGFTLGPQKGLTTYDNHQRIHIMNDRWEFERVITRLQGSGALRQAPHYLLTHAAPSGRNT